VFALTVLTDLPTAVEIGMILAGALFIHRISQTMQITSVDESTGAESAHNSLAGKTVPQGSAGVPGLWRVPVWGRRTSWKPRSNARHQEPEVLILKMQSVLAMDATGLNALQDIYEKLQPAKGGTLSSAARTHSRC